MASLLSILRIDTPMMSGRKARATSRERPTGSLAKQRSRNRTLCPAAWSADATHARPFGTTGYGWRSRLVLTNSTRAPSLLLLLLSLINRRWPYAIRDIPKATRAPTAEQTAFTTSLSNPSSPAAWMVRAPHVCTRRSVDVEQARHQRRAWRVAPRTESAKAPAIPPTATAAKGTGQVASVTSTAMNTAPASAARLPSAVRPPDVPAGTPLNERIETGPVLESVPTSVAHVSAVEAAIAPAPSASHSGDGEARCPRAATAKTPPLAST